MARVWLYGFEIQSIQTFIFSGGWLRDAVGANIITDGLVAPKNLGGNGLFCSFLSEQHFEFDESLFSQKNSGDAQLNSLENKISSAFLRQAASGIHFASCAENAGERLSAVRRNWRIELFDRLPDLQFIDALVSAETLPAAYSALREALLTAKQQPRFSSLLLTPAMNISARTGEPAQGTVRDSEGNKVLSAAGFIERHNALNKQANVVERFCDNSKAYYWPTDLDDFFENDNENHQVAVVHADGNAFGKMLGELNSTIHNTFSQDSANKQDFFDQNELSFIYCHKQIDETIAQTTRTALKKASEDVLIDKAFNKRINKNKETIIPARPLMQGGDDVLIILRSDLALDWTNCYLEAFEKEASQNFESLYKSITNLTNASDLVAPACVTASAGIALVRKGHPFTFANHLAESLTEQAKVASKKQATSLSTFAFFRMTQSMNESYDDILKNQLTINNIQLTLGVYRAGESEQDLSSTLPYYEDLRALYQVFKESKLGRGPLRELLTLISAGSDNYELAFQRWKKVNTRADKAAMQEFHKALNRLYAQQDQDAKLIHDNKTFLADLEAMRAAMAGYEDADKQD